MTDHDGWALFDPEGRVVVGVFRETQQAVLVAAQTRIGVSSLTRDGHTRSWESRWRSARRLGWRVAKVRVVPVEHKDTRSERLRGKENR